MTSSCPSPPDGYGCSDDLPVSYATPIATALHTINQDIFRKLRLGNIVIAATFGLTPSLLTNGLQSQAEQYKSDLRKSESSGTVK